MRIEDFLKEIEAKQAEISEQIVSRPVLGPGIEQHYLIAVGRHQGLELAKGIVMEALDKKAEREKDL